MLIGIVVFALQMYLWLGTGVFSGKWEIWTVTEAIFEWTMMLELIGYAATYCNKPSRLLSYANKAVYPFYILHMTVSYSLGYYLKNLEMSLFCKFSIIVIGTLGISWLIYELGIRRYAWIRPLFGMKRKTKH